MSHLYISESPILGICHITECCEVRVCVIAYSERGFLCILGNISHWRPTRAILFRCCQNLGPAWQSSGRDVYRRILQTCHFRGSKDMETERPRIRSTGWSPVVLQDRHHRISPPALVTRAVALTQRSHVSHIRVRLTEGADRYHGLALHQHRHIPKTAL